MWRLIVILTGTLALAGCATQGTNGRGGSSQSATTASSTRALGHAVGAALAYLSHNDPDVYVLDGYANPQPPSQGPISDDSPNRARAGACPTAAQPFPAADRAAIQAAFTGRTVHFVRDPVTVLHKPSTAGALLLGAIRADLRGERGTVTLLRCEPQVRRVPVDVQWDGHAWQALATG
jgi:hypothetical protein